MIDAADLARIEALVDDSSIAPGLEALVPRGARGRQLSVRTLIIGIMVTLFDSRPAHLSRVYEAQVGSSEADKLRLGVCVDWHGTCHTLTYRQVEYTYRRVTKSMSKKVPDGKPTDQLGGVVDKLLEASIPEIYKGASSLLAVDWTDVETFSSAPSKGELGADPEAAWGHRNSCGRGGKTDLCFGYYGSLATMVANEGRDEIPELVRRMVMMTCSADPVPAIAPVLQRLAASGISLGDILADSGYANRKPEKWAIALLMAGANIVTDLHPNDRGRQGTFAGAICFNANLYCPALAGKLRCPLRPDSMTLGFNRPEILGRQRTRLSAAVSKPSNRPKGTGGFSRQGNWGSGYSPD